MTDPLPWYWGPSRRPELNIRREISHDTNEAQEKCSEIQSDSPYSQYSVGWVDFQIDFICQTIHSSHFPKTSHTRNIQHIVKITIFCIACCNFSYGPLRQILLSSLPSGYFLLYICSLPQGPTYSLFMSWLVLVNTTIFALTHPHKIVSALVSFDEQKLPLLFLHVGFIMNPEELYWEMPRQQAIAFDLQIAGRGGRTRGLTLRGPFPDRES